MITTTRVFLEGTCHAKRAPFTMTDVLEAEAFLFSPKKLKQFHTFFHFGLGGSVVTHELITPPLMNMRKRYIAMITAMMKAIVA